MKFQVSIRLVMLTVLMFSGFLAGFLVKTNLVKKRELPTGGYSLVAPVGLVVRAEEIGKETFLVIPIGSSDGLRRGDIGVVTRSDKEIAIIALCDLETDLCVAKLVKYVGPELEIGFGDLVELTTLDSELIQEPRTRPRVDSGFRIKH